MSDYPEFKTQNYLLRKPNEKDLKSLTNDITSINLLKEEIDERFESGKNIMWILESNNKTVGTCGYKYINTIHDFGIINFTLTKNK